MRRFLVQPSGEALRISWAAAGLLQDVDAEPEERALAWALYETVWRQDEVIARRKAYLAPFLKPWPGPMHRVGEPSAPGSTLTYNFVNRDNLP